ncbi:hypothetical protein FB451DRAFT_1173361 [Mycena latifolia]|nr:hypothetical protein FB451DRAFT_1173361 [Mycena latifolia]
MCPPLSEVAAKAIRHLPAHVGANHCCTKSTCTRQSRASGGSIDTLRSDSQSWFIVPDGAISDPYIQWYPRDSWDAAIMSHGTCLPQYVLAFVTIDLLFQPTWAKEFTDFSIPPNIYTSTMDFLALYQLACNAIRDANKIFYGIRVYTVMELFFMAGQRDFLRLSTPTFMKEKIICGRFSSPASITVFLLPLLTNASDMGTGRMCGLKIGVLDTFLDASVVSCRDTMNEPYNVFEPTLIAPALWLDKNFGYLVFGQSWINLGGTLIHGPLHSSFWDIGWTSVFILIVTSKAFKLSAVNLGTDYLHILTPLQIFCPLPLCIPIGLTMLDDSKLVKHFPALLMALKKRIKSLPSSLPLGDADGHLSRYFGDLEVDAEEGAAFSANHQWERVFQGSEEEKRRNTKHDLLPTETPTKLAPDFYRPLILAPADLKASRRPTFAFHSQKEMWSVNRNFPPTVHWSHNPNLAVCKDDPTIPHYFEEGAFRGLNRISTKLDAPGNRKRARSSKNKALSTTLSTIKAGYLRAGTWKEDSDETLSTEEGRP